ncbi:PREDICTED: WD repeat-containing protein 44-like [Tarenaya hassleriana]|uniref:WD repeat-containing protein 44-like n=1 Tax=Tarenaya hassleriana TaxID=28532 RepID=UPI00053C5B17|nr:PREDICTED: WD repeat-containing protein 44-like [Tarenaya hassleriana]XP_010533562.1 PREDICTED: WD repeat-containing protein 44-like [Tarenaya hassleriana]XP_010533563.1 PREDICTED: WD repeat-containing protein 44-like [Tarenaya hassleriana]
MDTCGDEEDEFFDAREEVSSISDCNSEFSDDFSCLIDQETGGFDLWNQNPESVLSRRRRFFESMGFSFKKASANDYGDKDQSDETGTPRSYHSDQSPSDDYVDRVKNMLLRNESNGDRSSLSSLSNSLGDSIEDNVRRLESMDGEVVFVRNESSSSSCVDEALSEPGSSKSSNSSFGGFENSLLSHRERRDESTKKGTKGWLKKLSALRHVLHRHNDSREGESVGSPSRRLARVHSYKKHFKELSTLYVGQEFSAHDGSILTMKFSHDWKHLGTAGEDRVVRVWEITEKERADGFEVTESDSGSYAYFRTDDGLSRIEPLNSEKKRRLLKMSSDLTCVVLPPKVFAISEIPLHEFRGHTGEILDLSWSQKGLLLSSSVDKTVRLWRVGSHECLKVFSHKNFVTCVAFNPVDEDYFISGSIDGKVRMWDVSHCRVVDYTDVRDIVTAVCYRPDAKGAVAGTMRGDCRFYQILYDQLQLDREISLHGKRKEVPSKRITGLQYFPGDIDKLMVTCADSQIRILSGADLICKLKGYSLLTTLSTASASFTSDGKHIVSTTEDSSVNVWSYSSSQPNQKASSSSSSKKPKSIRSCERFVSDNTSVAVPWGPVDKNRLGLGFISDGLLLPQCPSSSSLDCLRGSSTTSTTTWPEEKLPRVESPNMKLLLRNGWPHHHHHHHLWGLVIVAATWDGKIRAFHNYGLPVRV